MTRLRNFKIITSAIILSIPSTAIASGVQVGSRWITNLDDFADLSYAIYGSKMSQEIYPDTLSRLQLKKLDGRFLFVSPSIEWFRLRVVEDGGILKKKYDLKLLYAYPHKVGSEIIWHYFERMGLVDNFDVVEEIESIKYIENNYDFIVFLRSDFDGKRDERSVLNRKYEYFVKNVNTGKEIKIAEVNSSPTLVGYFQVIARKFSDSVKLAK